MRFTNLLVSILWSLCLSIFGAHESHVFYDTRSMSKIDFQLFATTVFKLFCLISRGGMRRERIFEEGGQCGGYPFVDTLFPAI